jgi:long-subunit fatty acid transport protein
VFIPSKTNSQIFTVKENMDSWGYAMGGLWTAGDSDSDALLLESNTEMSHIGAYFSLKDTTSAGINLCLKEKEKEKG